MTTAPEEAVFDKGPFLRTPDPFNLAAHTLAAAQHSPDKLALEVIAAPGHLAEAWRYGDLLRAVRGVMTGLAQAGVQRGDRILLRLGNSVDFPLMFFAATGMGALPVPSSPQLTQREVDIAAQIVRPALTLADPGLTVPEGHVIGPETYGGWRDLPEAEFAPTAPDDPAYLLFTSGTGGQPKAVLHAHRAGWARRMMWRDWYDLRKGDRLLHAGAFNWSYTLGTGLTDPWAAGATALIYAGPPDKTIWGQVVAKHEPTIFAAAPGVYRQLLAGDTVSATDFAGLRHGLSAGEALPDAVRAAWTGRIGKPIYEALGMTEVSTYASQRTGVPGLQPQRGRRVAVLDPHGQPMARGAAGQLAVSRRDPGLMLGYWQDGAAPELPLVGGEWFVTGDLAQMDAEGALTHLGRADDVMNAQGYRVSAREVETVLLSHPGVSEVAALSLPVRQDVEVIAAAIVPTDHADVTADTLTAHCQQHLARYKCPRVFHFLPALPRTGTGKVLKRQLRRDLAQEEPS